MNWKELNSIEQLESLKLDSEKKSQVIFKHSTSCSISKMVWNRMERAKNLPDSVDYYYLDLLHHRDISNKIASDFDIEHESPQMLVIKDGKSVYDADHFGITVEDLESELA